MKKTKLTSIQTPTIVELLKRVELLEKQNEQLQAKLEQEKKENEAENKLTSRTASSSSIKTFWYF
ncbi:hypothetical protein MJG50_17010 [Fredinandcohnia sp. SECRCQ15]|uniref:Uncharacterized protein n=1 Tax=Fredinandcohnia quinoae TaxID=2918902 RepID=A0AAW5EAI0_9BACI|nr:hypothetical protein [Fredinandcohnia sp. SECRCQ15]